MAKDIDRLINNVTDKATQKALRALWNQIYADAAANKVVFNTHTHGCDGSAAGDYFCTTPALDATTDGQTVGTAATMVNNLTT